MAIVAPVLGFTPKSHTHTHPVHQSESPEVGDSGSVAEWSNRTCLPDFGILQPFIHGNQDVRRLEADHRSLGSESFHYKDPISDGDHPVGIAFGSSWRLDALGGSQRRVSSRSGSSFKPQISAIRGSGQSVTILRFVLWPHHGASSVYQGNGSGISLFSSFRNLCPALPGGLVSSSSFSRGSYLGNGQCSGTLRGPGYCRQPGEVLSGSFSDCVVSRGQDRLADFPGFTNSEDRKVLLNSRRISILRKAVCELWEGSAGSPGLPHSSGPKRSSPCLVASAMPKVSMGFSRRVSGHSLGRFLPGRPSLVVRRGSPRGGHFAGISPS